VKSTKKYKIVHVISNLSVGGAQILLFDILKNLKLHEEFDIFVVTINSGEYLKKYKESGIKVIDLKEKGLINLFIFFKLFKQIKNINPDIVHTHLNKADFYGRLAAKSAGVKLIYSTCHNYSTTHSGADINKKSFFDIIDNFVINYSKSNLIAISNLVKKYLSNRDERYKSITEVIYNGVNIKNEKYILNAEEQIELREKYNIGKDDFLISVIGRLEKQKNQLFFLESIKEKILRDKNISVLIIGDGAIRNTLEDFVKLNNLSEKVKFTGFIYNAEPFIEISDLICIPSLWEGFGLVVIEAMIKRKIVLASNVGGIPEIIEDGKNGYLFESQNKVNLSEKIDYLIDNKDKLDNIKQNAIDLIKEKFDIAKNSDLYYKSYIDKLTNLKF